MMTDSRPTQEIADYLAQLITEELQVEPATVSRSASFYDLGLDSLKLIDVSEALEDEYGVVITMSDLFDNPSIEGIAGYIAKGLERRGSSGTSDTN